MRYALAVLAILLVGCSGKATSDADLEAAKAPTLRTYPDDPNVKIGLAYSAKTTDLVHKLDLYLPKDATAKTPLLVFVHGGAWIGNDKELFRPYGEELRKQGIAVAVVNYRLSGGGKGIRVPDHARDVAEAVAFLAANKDHYTYDPKGIFMCGHSAGAHTVALLAVDGSLFKAAGVPKESLPKGYVGLEGIYDVPGLVAIHPNYIQWFIEPAFGSPDHYQKGSPSLIPIESKAPWIVVHSTGDTLVEIPQSKMFVEHLKKEQVPANYVEVSGLTHDAVVDNSTSPDSAINKAMRAMILAKP